MDILLFKGAVLLITLTLLIPTRSLDLRVNGEDVVEKIQHLAIFTDDPNPAVTRIIFTENDLHGRKYIKQLMTDVGLVVREDPMGNIFGRWEGSDPELGAILTGSHCDAIPLAGAYDGVVGVIGGIAALAALKDAGFIPKRSLEVVMFTSEEPTRFGLSCIGSRAMAGVLAEEELNSRLDVNGSTFLEAAASAGYGAQTVTELLEGTRLQEGRYSHFVELHIEQGPLLEEKGVNIGVVTGIAAPAALKVSFYGDGGHAGAQLMPLRNDALLAGAELALVVEKEVLGTGAEDTVGTTGMFQVAPGAVNSVPREAHLGIDIRDTDGPRRDSVVAAVLASAQSIAERRRVRVTTEVVNQDPPATSHADITRAAVEATEELGLSYMKMVSRAYHDSLFMARVAPTAMIFIPCYKGYSHRPDEFSSPEDIKNGVSVLALTMAKLSAMHPHTDKTEL